MARRAHSPPTAKPTATASETVIAVPEIIASETTTTETPMDPTQSVFKLRKLGIAEHLADDKETTFGRTLYPRNINRIATAVTIAAKTGQTRRALSKPIGPTTEPSKAAAPIPTTLDRASRLDPVNPMLRAGTTIPMTIMRGAVCDQTPPAG